MQFSIFPLAFTNYEIIKLPIAFPSINNLIIYFIILMIAIICGKKSNTYFLDNSQTDQIKGIAIILIVVSHLWFHVSQYRATPMLGDYSVTLFLMLSGFGLTRSLSKRPLLFADFLSRRLKKVLVPYWLITIIILLLDYYLLKRSYSLNNIILTFAGINVNPILRQLDYARWFITLLLIYYVAFFFANRFLKNLQAIYLLFCLGITLLLLKHYGIFQIGKYNQIIAFPIGCVMSYLYEDLSHLFNNSHRIKLFILSISLIIMATRIILFLIGDKYTYIYSITELFVYNVNGLLFCFLMILSISWIGVNNYTSRFLILCGTISYEIYLIHGPLLIKYNPLFNLIPVSLIAVSFLIYLFCILMLSYWFFKVNRILIV
jgi:peptidoglycan/LPS O-acetylase OafA/YrhL